jgi:ParB family chromosome partitioning protein
MAQSKSPKPPKPAGRRKKKAAAAPGSTGLQPAEMLGPAPPDVEALGRAIASDGGAVLATYREPLGGHWLVMAALPIDQVEPTPFQRGLSESHVGRLSDAIGKAGWYLDPVVAARVGEKKYQTPNGHHRASALKRLGARAVTALVVTDPAVARLILALNVEKAHNLREKSLEALRLARELAKLPPTPEQDFALEFEQAAFLTLGLCYEQNGRFAGGAYHPLLRRADTFLAAPLARALEQRDGWAKALLAIDAKVSDLAAALKAKGLDSPYLKNFVVARINPLRFQRTASSMPLSEALDRMAQAAARFDPAQINVADLARGGGAPGEAAGEGGDS